MFNFITAANERIWNFGHTNSSELKFLLLETGCLKVTREEEIWRLYSGLRYCFAVAVWITHGAHSLHLSVK